jgi:hypothetical protein
MTYLTTYYLTVVKIWENYLPDCLKSLEIITCIWKALRKNNCLIGGGMSLFLGRLCEEMLTLLGQGENELLF